MGSNLLPLRKKFKTTDTFFRRRVSEVLNPFHMKICEYKYILRTFTLQGKPLGNSVQN